jgi:hypothetical protein
MPIADWGISKGVVDGFDREAQDARYKPYTGPKPPAGVYRWVVVKDMMKFQAGDDESFPRWSALLSLKARTRSEKPFEGFTAWFSANVSNDNPQWYVPMLDVLGVSDLEFRRKTRLTEEGAIKSIGAWRNDGTQELLAQVRYNGDYTNITWVGKYDESSVDEDEDEETEYEEEDDDLE